MKGLGNPHNYFPSIHVAGTNGKGSVTALIARVLQEAGLSVGMYTSPHLESVNERFQVNGRMISNRDLNRLARFVIRKYPHLTQFEFLTVLAFLWFAEKKVDVAVIEAGLGGRLDATNVLSRVLVSVITNIDFDHTNHLGSTIRKIAWEKAGIIKGNIPVVTAATGAALATIKSVARKKNAPVAVVSAGDFHFKILLKGEHQEQNASIAVRVLHLLAELGFFHISEKNIRTGFSQVKWPGRFEQMRGGVILDGAHNPAGCRALAQTLIEKKLVPINLLFGALKDKDVNQMARVLSSVTSHCVTVPVPSERSARAEELANLGGWRGKATSASSIVAGWRALNLIESKHPRVVAGSLYLVGEMRRRLK